MPLQLRHSWESSAPDAGGPQRRRSSVSMTDGAQHFLCFGVCWATNCPTEHDARRAHAFRAWKEKSMMNGRAGTFSPKFKTLVVLNWAVPWEGNSSAHFQRCVCPAGEKYVPPHICGEKVSTCHTPRQGLWMIEMLVVTHVRATWTGSP